MNKLYVLTISNVLAGSFARNFFTKKNFLVKEIDKNLKKYFFCKEASTKLINIRNFSSYNTDIKNYYFCLKKLFIE